MSIDQGVTTGQAFTRTRGATQHRVAAGDRGAVRTWLWIVAATIFLMVFVGGATRLTESGLSITEWEPLFGAIPPLTAAAWDAKFEAYKQIPQFTLHPDMTLGAFKTIFFWEWSHRLIGRALGLVIAVPLAVFWIAGRLTNALKMKLVGLLLLVGIQGAVGWWMVKSGLTERTEVSQYRLATHLLLATFTLGYVVWTEEGLRSRVAEHLGTASARFRWCATVLLGLVFCQIGLGALVAGLRAGLVFNTWPLMGGALTPSTGELLFQHPAWRNVFENATTVQFQHRTVAYMLLLGALAHAIDVRRTAPGSGAAWRSSVLAALVLCQATIGIVTLVWAVPLTAALAHQAVAMVVLVAAVIHRRGLAPANAGQAARAQTALGREAFSA